MNRGNSQKPLASSNPIVADAHILNNEPSSGNEKIAYAKRLYERAKTLSQDLKNPDEHIAKLIIESADDAIKEFGTTNQDQKVELRKIKAEAERILPPDTIESLRKRAEGELLQKVYPKQRNLRRLLLLVIAIAILVIPLVLGIKQLTKSQPPMSTMSGTNELERGQDSPVPEVSKQLPAPNQTNHLEEQAIPSSRTQIPKPLSQYVKRARLLYEQGQYQAALSACDKALTIMPGNQEVLHLKKRIKKTLEVLK